MDDWMIETRSTVSNFTSQMTYNGKKGVLIDVGKALIPTYSLGTYPSSRQTCPYLKEAKKKTLAA